MHASLYVGGRFAQKDRLGSEIHAKRVPLLGWRRF
jgi:hypothetical protein